MFEDRLTEKAKEALNYKDLTMLREPKRGHRI